MSETIVTVVSKQWKKVVPEPEVRFIPMSEANKTSKRKVNCNTS